MKKAYVFYIPDQTGNLNTACIRCQELMDLLTAESIPFTPINVPASTANREIWNNIKRQCQGIMLVFPTVFIQDDSDGSGYVYAPGRDFYTPHQAKEIVKNNI